MPSGLECGPAAGFVLAGGQSRRMGCDKALTPFAGEPLIFHALKLLRDAGFEPGIAGARGDLTRFAPVIADVEPDPGPLGGMCAALATCLAPRAVFIPVDLPLLPASLVSFLVRRAAISGAVVTVPSVNGFVQTFPAVVDRTALPALEDSLRHGSGGCYAAFESAALALHGHIVVVPVEYLAQAGQVTHPEALPPAIWFLNVNSPADLARAEAVFRRASRVI